jgi:tetratricopeptide (TPR) repeat protein
MEKDKFCAECGMFLRDAWVEQRLLAPLLLEMEGKPQEARRELERLVEMQPQNALAQHLLGTVHFHQGTLNRAIDCYRKALALAPRFLLCWYDLGVAYYHRGNMPASIEAYRECLAIDPDYNAAHYRLGVALFHAGDLDQAQEHFERCSALTPEYVRARYFIGVIHERRGAWDAALREFRSTDDDGIGEVSSLWHMAAVYRAKGDTKAADEAMARANRFAAEMGAIAR